jgi:hypothetical protein
MLPEATPVIPQIVEDKVAETETKPAVEKGLSRRLSKNYSTDQLDILRKILDVQDSDPPPSDLYDDIVVQSPPTAAAWGLDTDNYVDMQMIDFYDTIPDLPKKKNFYYNIDDKPPRPPKPPKAKPRKVLKPGDSSKSSAYGKVVPR